ncbi:methylenetetrahydrofolate reductase [Haloarcula argentinensis]|uniref:Methylenetetrahydrofolate reductase n=1 Tax=Haloarcula argentinensis TaxID=43776 RepID=A0A847US99_HALAR|nr:methylenetetrahydrofolate reductase [Haloarcula argentinensis]NLV15244.1 methylenetetrahydrofolate reductase [Haloarcula argentinensis]
MALGTRTVPDSQGVRTLLTSARFELMPFESFDEEITHLPDDATIAITTSPQLGIEKTVEKTEEAAAMGYDVVPHIAARYVEDRTQLESIAERLKQAGITDIFVPGGDREEPAGEYESALDMLEALAETAYSFEEVGITGYPEGHDFIDDETLAESMTQKAPYATYIVTQLCYDPDAVLEWVEDIRARGIELPVEVGIPGVMNYQRLMQISQKVGVGDSIKFLRKTTGILGFVKQLVGSRGTYEPDELIDGLAPYVGDDEYNIRGVHIYTFNQTPDTEEWRHGRLDS